MTDNHHPPTSFAEGAEYILQPAREVGFPVDTVIKALTALHDSLVRQTGLECLPEKFDGHTTNKGLFMSEYDRGRNDAIDTMRQELRRRTRGTE